MTARTPYLMPPGTAREALAFYGNAFRCAVQLHPLAELDRSDGPASGWYAPAPTTTIKLLP